MMGLFKLTIKGKSKPRPAFDSRSKRAYMPEPYMAWKKKVGNLIIEAKIPRENFEGPVALEVIFGRENTWIQIVPISTFTVRPKGLKLNDLDNLVGGIMDALQDCNVIKNDVQVLQIDASFQQEGDSV
jgi:Holliday junction resolvase RusA-like endonuclease